LEAVLVLVVIMIGELLIGIASLVHLRLIISSVGIIASAKVSAHSLLLSIPIATETASKAHSHVHTTHVLHAHTVGTEAAEHGHWVHSRHAYELVSMRQSYNADTETHPSCPSLV
jgi:hypothetical protein